MKKAFTQIIILFLAAVVVAQTPVLLKDINPGAGNSIPQFEKGAIEWNGKIYFAANDGSTGNELWVTDGTAAGTVLLKDINPGAAGSDCQNFFPTSNFIYFTATDGTHGLELWRTDGTEAGTQLIKDIRPGNASGVYVGSFSQYRRLYLWNDVLYFSANEGTNGVELWKSDGTDAGTVLVKNINTASFDSYPVDFEAYNGKLYFQAKNSAGAELWVTDGTNSGTSLVKDINTGSFGSNASDMVSCNGYLLFIADDDVAQMELWRSDGTAAGTVLVKDINPAQFGNGMQTSSNAGEKKLFKIGDKIYFSANDGTNGAELWVSDGTDAGTVMVKDASVDNPGYAPQNFAVLNNILYYKYDDAINGHELWRSDGTDLGTFMVKDVYPGSLGSFSLPTNIAAVEGKIWFGADGPNSTGIELWTSDGTEDGTQMVANINPGFADSRPFQFVGLPDLLLFAATGPAGTELYTINLNVVPLSIDLMVTNNIACFGEASGTLELGITGGVAPYTITWSPSIAQGQNPTNLPAGNYAVTVTDSNGDNLTAQAEITQPTQIVATTSSVAATYSNANGSASVATTGGISPYTFLWNNGTTLAAINNVIAGDYTVTITDTNGCTAIATVTVDMETAAHEAFASSLQIAPSITNTNQFSLLASGNKLSGLEVRLSDSQGRMVKQWKDVSTGQVLPMEGQNLIGVYFVTISNGDEVAIKKIVFVK